MTVTSKVLRQGILLPDSQTTQYTSTGVKTIIDGASVCNISASPVDLSINLVAAGGSADSSNRILLDKTIAAGETDLLPELRGRRLDVGDFVSTDASAASALAFRMEGRQIT